MDTITRITVEIWNIYAKKESKILNRFACDSRFIPGIIDKGFKQWVNKGIRAICTMAEKGKMQIFENLRDKFGLDEHEKYQYLQIRDYYEKEIKAANKVIEVFKNGGGTD